MTKIAHTPIAAVLAAHPFDNNPVGGPAEVVTHRFAKCGRCGQRLLGITTLGVLRVQSLRGWHFGGWRKDEVSGEVPVWRPSAYHRRQRQRALGRIRTGIGKDEQQEDDRWRLAENMFAQPGGGWEGEAEDGSIVTKRRVIGEVARLPAIVECPRCHRENRIEST